jgi:hypothetical protein
VGPLPLDFNLTLSSEAGISIAPLPSVPKHISPHQPAWLSWADLTEAFRRIDKKGEGVATLATPSTL